MTHAPSLGGPLAWVTWTTRSCQSSGAPPGDAPGRMAAWGEDAVRDEPRGEWLALLLAPETPAFWDRRSRPARDDAVDDEEERKPVECGR